VRKDLVAVENKVNDLMQCNGLLNCTKCNLCKTRTQVVPGYGNSQAKVMFCGEAPGLEEDRAAMPFIGPAGKLLDTILKEVNLNRNDLYITNVVKCRPVSLVVGKENRAPSAEEIELCSPYLEEEIKQIQPKIIVLLGNIALKYFLKDRGVNIMSQRGNLVFDKEHNCHLLPVLHPAALLRRPEYVGVTVTDLLKVNDILSDTLKEKHPVEYTFIDTFEKCEQILSELIKVPLFSADIETTDLDFLRERIICISFAWQAYTGYCLPFLKEDGSQFWTDQQYEFILNKLKEAFANDNKKVGQNFKFDMKFLRRYGIEVNNLVCDTLLAHHLIDENMQGMHGLKDLARIYTDMGGYENELMQYQKEHRLKHSFLGTPYSILYKYSAADADCTFRLYHIFMKKLEEENLLKLFNMIVMPMQKVLFETEWRGVSIDREYLEKVGNEYTNQLKELETEIMNKVGEVFNLRSTKQLRTILFEKLKLKATKKTKTGFSTDEEVLAELAKTHEVPKLILKHREIQKLNSTYVKGIKELLDDTNRVHTTYSQSGTATGRLSSSSPNLQNIPRESDIRKFFVAAPGYLLLEGDMAQIEYRIWAHYANDPKMIADIASGVDIHRIIASTVLQKPADQVTKAERTYIKTVTYGVLYGRSAWSLAKAFNVSEKQAQGIIDTFFSMYPSAKLCIDNIQAEAVTTGVLTNFFGRKRRLVGLSSLDEKVRAMALRQAVNFPFQGTAADLTNFAAVRIAPQIKKYDAHLVLQVHDALFYEIPEQHISIVANIVRKEMERKITGMRVPINVEIKVGKRWGELEKYIFEQEPVNATS
jgi:DNA polymerase-1